MSNLCSVVCATYNHAAYSEASLQSLFDQSYRDLEIVVIDDGSTDSNVELIQRKLEDSPFPATLITQENSGNVPKNFNTALKRARGEFVTFLSLDDLLLPDCIAEKVDIMSRNSDVAFVANTTHDEIDGQGAVVARGVRMPLDPSAVDTVEDLLEAEFKTIGSFYIQGQLFRKDLIDTVGGFEDSMTGDDIILRTKVFKHLAGEGEVSFRFLPSAGFAYRKHETNLHKRTFRQIKTVIEWKEAYFPDRDYPELFYRWLDHFFNECVREDKSAELRQALEFAPVIAKHHEAYRSTWKYRRRALKRRLKEMLAPSRP